MKEQDRGFPSFDDAKHSTLCYELKQLYVAVSRTRQRLWIYENVEELSNPMFDYWKKKCLVQVRQLDDSFALSMQVASSPQEWKARGIKVCLIMTRVIALSIDILIIVRIVIMIIMII